LPGLQGYSGGLSPHLLEVVQSKNDSAHFLPKDYWEKLAPPQEKTDEVQR